MFVTEFTSFVVDLTANHHVFLNLTKQFLCLNLTKLREDQKGPVCLTVMLFHEPWYLSFWACCSFFSYRDRKQWRQTQQMYSQLIENHLELLFLLPTAHWTGALASVLSSLKTFFIAPRQWDAGFWIHYLWLYYRFVTGVSLYSPMFRWSDSHRNVEWNLTSFKIDRQATLLQY